MIRAFTIGGDFNVSAYLATDLCNIGIKCLPSVFIDDCEYSYVGFRIYAIM